MRQLPTLPAEQFRLRVDTRASSGCWSFRVRMPRIYPRVCESALLVFKVWDPAEASTAVANNNPADKPRHAAAATIARRIVCELLKNMKNPFYLARRPQVLPVEARPPDVSHRTYARYLPKSPCQA